MKRLTEKELVNNLSYLSKLCVSKPKRARAMLKKCTAQELDLSLRILSAAVFYKADVAPERMDAFAASLSPTMKNRVKKIIPSWAGVNRLMKLPEDERRQCAVDIASALTSAASVFVNIESDDESEASGGVPGQLPEVPAAADEAEGEELPQEPAVDPATDHQEQRRLQEEQAVRTPCPGAGQPGTPKDVPGD